MSRGEHSAVDSRMIQADFDRIAALSDERWDHNSYYHPFLLQHLPPRCESVLDGDAAPERSPARWRAGPIASWPWIWPHR